MGSAARRTTVPSTKPRRIWKVQAVLRKSGSSPRSSCTIDPLMPKSENIATPVSTTCTMAMMPKASGNSSRVSTRLEVRRRKFCPPSLRTVNPDERIALAVMPSPDATVLIRCNMGLALPRGDAGEGGLEGVRGMIPGVAARPAMRRLRHRAPGVGRERQRLDQPRAETLGIVDIGQVAVDARFDQVRRGPRPGGHDRRAAGHGFQKRQAETLRARAEEPGIAGRVDLRDFLLGRAAVVAGARGQGKARLWITLAEGGDLEIGEPGAGEGEGFKHHVEALERGGRIHQPDPGPGVPGA